MSVIRRLPPVALLFALLVAPCLSLCAGWSASDHARMACCVDKSQNEADSCCASGEGRQNADVFAGLMPAALPAPTAGAGLLAAVLFTPRSIPPQWDRHDHVPSSSDRRVLLSVFLI